jgi:phosphoglycolate phosphatase
MKNIIFDWSGVVKDAVTAQLWIINRIFGKHGIQPISLEVFRANWEQPYQLFYNKYLPQLSLEEEQRDYREAIQSADCPKSGSCPGMVEFVKALKSKAYFLAVVSSDHAENVRREIHEYGLDEMFTEVITDVHDKLEGVNDIVRRYGLRLDETYFVGDSNHEVEVARKTGIRSVAVTWGFSTEQRLQSVNPDFIVRDIHELENIIP